MKNPWTYGENPMTWSDAPGNADGDLWSEWGAVTSAWLLWRVLCLDKVNIVYGEKFIINEVTKLGDGGANSVFTWKISTITKVGYYPMTSRKKK